MIYSNLRREHPIFSFVHFQFSIIDHKIIDFEFLFKIGENIIFRPKMQLNLGKYAIEDISVNELEGLIFHIGMIEMVSYWKATCSPTIHIHGFSLTPEQQQWWKKLYYNGLGEFLYQNNIQASIDDFVRFTFDHNAKPSASLNYKYINASNRIIVPVGGGKDSVVTLEELRSTRTVIPFIINPRQASLDCARMAGFTAEDEIIILKRQIDPKLLELNRLGFLNGHTPFSAMLAFHSLLVSYGTNTREIALSNESSANESTIPGSNINHQYSKSGEFELDFRQYVNTYMNGASHYFSFLRSLNELQIAEKFASYPAYFPIFRSCNVGSKEDRWCGQCPKCLFTAIILAPFISREQLSEIFEKEIFNQKELQRYFDELTGIAEHKPFECVGTIEEVNAALRMISEQYKDTYLIQHYIKELS